MTWFTYKELVYSIVKEKGTLVKVKNPELGKILGRVTKVHEIGDSMWMEVSTASTFETHSVHDIISYVTEVGVEQPFPRHSITQQTLW
jgi:hypothetical protein